MKIRKTYLGIALALATLSLQAQSTTPKVTVHLDPQKTEIHWRLKSALRNVHGTFQLKGGAVTFDPENGAAQGQILVDLVTGQSGNQSRDRKMQDEVLETKRYPQAFFHPVKVSKIWKEGAAQDVTIDGTFNIHGQDHPLTLQVKVQGTRADSIAVTHFTVPYVDWGMKYPGSFFTRVDKQVEVEITAHGTVEGMP